MRISTWKILLEVMVYMRLVQMAASCSKSWVFNGSMHTFVNCVDLPVQGASLAWTLSPPSSSSPSSSSSSSDQDYYLLEVAFSGTAPSANGWVGWGLNPEKAQMAGSSTFLAYNAPNGSTVLPYRLTAATLGGAPLVCSAIDYRVQDSAVQISGVSMWMLVSLLLLNASASASAAPTTTTLFHVWNRGPSVANFQPAPHSMLANDLKALAQIDMSSGLLPPSTTTTHTQILKIRHGVINAVAWGFLLPMGVFFARYLKPFADPIWFYLHILLQCGGYVLGASGWATGLQLERAAHGVVFHKHRNIGMVLFALSSLQVMALLVRPKKEHSLRRYWNIYHHSVGYMVIVLGIINVFLGLAILGVSGWPYHAFICGLVALGAIALLLENITWFIFIKRWRKEYSLRESSMVSHSYEKKPSNGAFGPTEHILRVL